MRHPATLPLAALTLAFAVSARASDPGPMRRLFGWGSDPLRDKYEELFDQKFPARGYDPFNRLRPFDDVRAFNRAFDQRTDGVSRLVKSTDDQVIMVVTWPGSADQEIDVDVRRGLVTLRPSKGVEATGGWRFRSAMTHEVELEVPQDAIGSTARTTREGDHIRIAFNRRKPFSRRVRELWSGGLLYPPPDISGGLGGEDAP